MFSHFRTTKATSFDNQRRTLRCLLENIHVQVSAYHTKYHDLTFDSASNQTFTPPARLFSHPTDFNSDVSSYSIKLQANATSSFFERLCLDSLRPEGKILVEGILLSVRCFRRRRFRISRDTTQREALF